MSCWYRETLWRTGVLLKNGSSVYFWRAQNKITSFTQVSEWVVSHLVRKFSLWSCDLLLPAQMHQLTKVCLSENLWMIVDVGPAVSLLPYLSEDDSLVHSYICVYLTVCALWSHCWGFVVVWQDAAFHKAAPRCRSIHLLSSENKATAVIFWAEAVNVLELHRKDIDPHAAIRRRNHFWYFLIRDQILVNSASW